MLENVNQSIKQLESIKGKAGYYNSRVDRWLRLLKWYKEILEHEATN